MLLIPVKDLNGAKQRLASVLSQPERTALAEAMLADVLSVVAAWAAHPRMAVVTSYPFAAEKAREYGFEVIPDGENRGETEAIAMATRVAESGGADCTLVIPADIPLIEAGELEAIWAAAPAQGMVLVPSADGRGSNAVLRRPAGLIPLRFGNDSFVPHRAAALATGHACVVLELPGIGLDIDTPADLAALMARPTRSRAQRLLASWNAGERLAAARHA